MNVVKVITLLIHAFVIWVLCGATIGIGMAVTSMQNTLINHAIAAPIFAAVVSLVYFRKFNFTTPLQTATIFTSFIITMDFLIVAMLINRNFEMFTSLLGTWIPFGLIFASTYLTGLLTRQNRQQGNMRTQ